MEKKLEVNIYRKNHFDVYAKRHWLHGSNCICKIWEEINAKESVDNSSLTTYVEPTILKDKINKKEVLNEWLNK